MLSLLYKYDGTLCVVVRRGSHPSLMAAVGVFRRAGAVCAWVVITARFNASVCAVAEPTMVLTIAAVVIPRAVGVACLRVVSSS